MLLRRLSPKVVATCAFIAQAVFAPDQAAANENGVKFLIRAQIPKRVIYNINGQRNGKSVALIHKGDGIIRDAIRMDTVLTNYPIHFNIRVAGWQGLTQEMPEVQIRVREVQSQEGAMTAAVGEWITVTPDGLPFLKAGEVTSEGFIHGLRGGQAVIDARILMPSGLPGSHVKAVLAIDWSDSK